MTLIAESHPGALWKTLGPKLGLSLDQLYLPELSDCVSMLRGSVAQDVFVLAAGMTAAPSAAASATP